MQGKIPNFWVQIPTIFQTIFPEMSDIFSNLSFFIFKLCQLLFSYK